MVGAPFRARTRDKEERQENEKERKKIRRKESKFYLNKKII